MAVQARPYMRARIAKMLDNALYRVGMFAYIVFSSRVALGFLAGSAFGTCALPLPVPCGASSNCIYLLVHACYERDFFLHPLITSLVTSEDLF